MGSNAKRVTRADYSSEWPLTVSGGVLVCVPVDRVIFRAANGTTYWINETAKTVADENDWKDVRRIWKDDPDPLFEGTGIKISIGPLIDDGLALC